MALSHILVFSAALVILVAFLTPRLKRHSLGRRPPGPKGWPIVGNISDIPHKNPWITYTEWKKLYGDIVYVEPFGSPNIILNDLDDIHEILDRRSANTSDRPPLIMANELMGWSWDFAHMRYSDYWRRHRKMFHQYFQSRNMPRHFPLIQKAMTTLMNQLTQTPDSFRNHVRQFGGTVVLKMTYDYEVQPKDDYYIALVENALEGLLQAVHVGAYMVDFIPVLKYIPAWFPGAQFKRDGEKYCKFSDALRDVPFAKAKKAALEGNLGPCFVSEVLSKENVEEEVLKNSAAIAYIAGSDTTVAVVLTFMAAMLHYPEVQARAQKEIDTIIGTSRLPSFDDRPSLPYVEAVLTETMRWNPPTPLAVPHRLLEADFYKGYYLPAGANVIPNVWGVFHDEENFPEPFEFRPERFLEAKRNSLEAIFNPASMGVFGYGRRVCPGRHVAVNSAWLAIAQILATFNITPKRDEHGNATVEPLEFVSGLIVHPKPFDVNITPRSEEALKLIRRAKAEA